METMNLFCKPKFNIGDKVKINKTNDLYHDYKDLPLIISGIVKYGDDDYDPSMGGEILYKFSNIQQTLYESEILPYGSI